MYYKKFNWANCKSVALQVCNNYWLFHVLSCVPQTKYFFKNRISTYYPKEWCINFIFSQLVNHYLLGKYFLWYCFISWPYVEVSNCPDSRQIKIQKPGQSLGFKKYQCKPHLRGILKTQKTQFFINQPPKKYQRRPCKKTINLPKWKWALLWWECGTQPH